MYVIFLQVEKVPLQMCNVRDTSCVCVMLSTAMTVLCQWCLNEYGALVEWYWWSKIKMRGENPVPGPLHPLKFPPGLAWGWTQASTLWRQQLICWPIAQSFSETHNVRFTKVCRWWVLYHIDIFVNCNWVVTRWQKYSIYLHTNNTKNDTKQYIEQHNNFGRVRAVPRLG
jgi:hypothetical protein